MARVSVPQTLLIQRETSIANSGSPTDLIPAALLLGPCAAEAAATALGLHQGVVARAGAGELTALLRPDLHGDASEGQRDEADAKKDGDQCGAHARAKVAAH